MARQRRWKVPEDHPVGFYHCISRIVDRQFLLGPAEKEHFVSLMRELEEFCEVQVLTYAVMDNHFHVLVAVPHRPEKLPPAEEILAKLKRLSGHQDAGAALQELERCRKDSDADGEVRWLERFYARMWDVSAFMKLLKQRFTQWYNGTKGRKGTLWEERFKSVLVEEGPALARVGAYIDLNGVRAGRAKDPKDYRWSGYAEAAAGRKRARLGVQRVVKGLQRGQEESLSKSLAVYRMHMFNEGREEREGLTSAGKSKRGALSREARLEVLKQKGVLPAPEYLLCKARYWTDGVVLGTKTFVEEIFQKCRDRFGKKRTDGARRMRGLEEELYTIRDLRLNLFG